MSETLSNSPPPADSSMLLGKLLSNPDLIRNIASMLGTSNIGATEQTAPAPPAVPSTSNVGTTEQTAPAPPAVPSTSGEGAVADGISRVLSNPEMMAKLPEVMKMLAPMMQPSQSSTGESASVSATSVTSAHAGGGHDRRGCRNDLLVALKPFLSPERCRAIDMLLGLSRLGDALQKMI